MRSIRGWIEYKYISTVVQQTRGNDYGHNLSWPGSKDYGRYLFEAPSQLVITRTLIALATFALNNVIRRVDRVAPHQIVRLRVPLVFNVLIRSWIT
jgi:hypothetical protein